MQTTLQIGTIFGVLMHHDTMTGSWKGDVLSVTSLCSPVESTNSFIRAFTHYNFNTNYHTQANV